MSPLSLGMRLVLGALGAGSFGTGVVAVFVTENGTGSAVLLAFGGLLLVFALIGERIESIGLGDATVRLRAEAAERLALAEESERRGRSAEAGRLRAEARALLDAADRRSGDSWRRSLRSPLPDPDGSRGGERPERRDGGAAR
ncbi:hypothetical protein [Thermostaphylospora chromogena]|uniref:Uncharacterized protein n=1 Tax=Thermostaphylospora chromogena TaxID=35622 RepID=A0A1H1A5X9_9ACTN|nr:hypothetical protein [Thermostaphylospora chromogena]SDQ35118.1 hypothetical protein SAMN04489764_0340 [Thermostaphylospora chromogena]